MKRIVLLLVMSLMLFACAQPADTMEVEEPIETASEADEMGISDVDTLENDLDDSELDSLEAELEEFDW